MFTGIIEHLGKVLTIERILPLSPKAEPMQNSRSEQKSARHGLSLAIQSPFRSVSIGESVAVDGVCLTIVKKRKKKTGMIFIVEVSEETLKKTTLGRVEVGEEVNLERPLKLNDRLGGHFVQGHVDSVGKILNIVPEGNSKLFSFSYPSFLQPFIVSKGSIAIDGISLTVANLQEDSFSVAVLQYTEQQTCFRNKQAGDAVNLEADILAKIVARQIQTGQQGMNPNDDLYQKKELEWNELMKEEGYL